MPEVKGQRIVKQTLERKTTCLQSPSSFYQVPRILEAMGHTFQSQSVAWGGAHGSSAPDLSTSAGTLLCVKDHAKLACPLPYWAHNSLIALTS